MEELNLIGIKCPLNFVKAKLKLNKMPEGESLKIIVDLGESSESVEKSLKTENYKIISNDTNLQQKSCELIVCK